MIALAAALALIALLAVVVTIVDAVRAPHWREVAAQRRLAWDDGTSGGSWYWAADTLADSARRCTWRIRWG
jgi:hypothetical protein